MSSPCSSACTVRMAEKPSGSAMPVGWWARTSAGAVHTVGARTRAPISANSSISAGEASLSALAKTRTYRPDGDLGSVGQSPTCSAVGQQSQSRLPALTVQSLPVAGASAATTAPIAASRQAQTSPARRQGPAPRSPHRAASPGSR
jgi:hypothetical protein